VLSVAEKRPSGGNRFPGGSLTRWSPAPFHEALFRQQAKWSIWIQRAFIVKAYIGKYMIDVLIRRPEPEEHDSVRAVVQTVVDEIYGGLWAPPPLPVDKEDWHSFWIAVKHAKIIGVVRTSGEWLDDLWVLRESRGYGVGQRLLAQAEAEIIARGHETLHLRVVQSNAAGIEFYRRHGWCIARAFPHERFPITMVEMFKPARQDER
jgi:ribosomal protein S18 acetylase RimI-like enzyme